MAELKECIKNQNKTASEWLINYQRRKKEHEEKKQEIYIKKEKAARLNTGPAKPTEILAVNLVDHDCFNNTAKWLETIETTERMLGYKKQLLLKLRQENGLYAPAHAGRPGWIARVQVRFGEIENWCPAEQVLRNMWNDIVNLTVRLAFMKNCKF